LQDAPRELINENDVSYPVARYTPAPAGCEMTLRGGWWDATQRGRERPHCQHALSSIQVESPPIHLTQTPINRARTAIGCLASRIERAGVPIDAATTSIELAPTPTDRRPSPTELESVPMELSWNPVERLGVPCGRHRIPTARARTSIARPRTLIGRAGVPCRSAWTAIVAQRFAFQRARVARLAQRPRPRTTASGS